jgi:hypothetical protein
VILHDRDLRTVKVRSTSGSLNEDVRLVEADREGGKVKQRVVADRGRNNLLVEILPKLQRLRGGDVGQGDAAPADPEVVAASTGGPVRAVRVLVDQRGLGSTRDEALGKAKGGPVPDRAVGLVAHRLLAPASEHGRAGWLETDFVGDRRGRRFVPPGHARRRVRVPPRQWDAWYRTLDQLIAAKDRSEVALDHRLRDRFRLKPELVLSDLTSTSFEGAGPVDFAQHGSSRDGKPPNVPVLVGVVMVAGGPIAPHVWAGKRLDHGTVPQVVHDRRPRFEVQRLVFVGDRGLVTEANRESLTKEDQGFLVGRTRRRHETRDGGLATVDESRWIDCPVGLHAQERKTNPPRTRAPEVPSGVPGMRVLVIDSDARRTSAPAMRPVAMERAREKWEKLKERVASGDLKKPEKIAAAAERILPRSPGDRYSAWELRPGAFAFFESETHLGREKRIEGVDSQKVVIALGSR